MAELRNARKTERGTIRVSNADLEDFARQQLREYDPRHFDGPHPLDIDDFVEFHLGRTVRYYRLSHGDEEGRTLGTTAVTDGILPIIDDEGFPDVKAVRKGDIAIDEAACGSEERRRFTLAHEAWHSQFDVGANLAQVGDFGSLSDTFLSIEGKTVKVRKRTQRDWSEYHADVYASYLLMPREFVCELFDRYHRTLIGSGREIDESDPELTWNFARRIAEDLGVSTTAAIYRLRRLNLITKEVLLSVGLGKKEGGAK